MNQYAKYATEIIRRHRNTHVQTTAVLHGPLKWLIKWRTNTNHDQPVQWHRQRKQIRRACDTVPSLPGAVHWQLVLLQCRPTPPSIDSDSLAALLIDSHAQSLLQCTVWSGQWKLHRLFSVWNRSQCLNEWTWMQATAIWPTAGVKVDSSIIWC